MGHRSGHYGHTSAKKLVLPNHVLAQSTEKVGGCLVEFSCMGIYDMVDYFCDV